MANVTGLAAARARAARARGLGPRGAGPQRRAAAARAGRRGGARDGLARAAAARVRARGGRGRRRRRPGRDARRRARLGARGRRRRGDRVRAGGQRQHAARSTRSTEIAAAAREHGAWVHVDGAFGLWAAASPALARLVAGAGDADSWATDGHKWLNVPYDCGVVAVRDRAAHVAAMGDDGLLPVRSGDAERSNSDWVPEASRRGRGFAVYAALRSLGRDGVAELVERCCALARRLARAGRPPRASRCSTTSCSTRCCCASARGRVRSVIAPRAGGRDVLGRAGRAGTAGRRCASRSRAGRRPRPTSTAPPTRSRSAPLGERRDHRLVDAGAV